MRHGKKIWVEDDATPGTEGHETLNMAWQRLFGEPLPKHIGEVEDCGDHFYKLMPNEYVVCICYDGDHIYEPPQA